MRRAALRDLLRSLLAGFPVFAGACLINAQAPPETDESYYAPVPDGAFGLEGGTMLPEEACTFWCNWGALDAGGDCFSVDPDKTHECSIVIDGGSSVLCKYVKRNGCALGRQPTGLQPALVEGDSPVGIFLAEMAHLEAASVDAFEILEGELLAFGAPLHLLAKARRAAQDERRHARRVAELSRRYGGRPVSPTVTRPQVLRSKLAVARENAVEGCVGETHGALVAGYQALRALDPDLRTTMAGIAEDETRHAELAWAIARWIEPRLAQDERAMVTAARKAAGEAAAAGAACPVDRTLIEVLGLPPPEVARALAEGLRGALWTA